MAVYTHIEHHDLVSLLDQYEVGNLVDFKGITAGVENSNYIVKTDQHQFILTIYEARVNPKELPFFLELMLHLSQHHIPCPTTIAQKDGTLLGTICDKPCALISFLNGKSAQSIKNFHLGELGMHMARMHQAAESFGMSRNNTMTIDDCRDLFNQVATRVDTIKPNLGNEIEGYLNDVLNQWPHHIPSGVIHGDLFPDNVFFEDEHLSGIIDYYFACNDAYMYDLAICLNAWCFERNQEFNLTKARLLLSSYNKVRHIGEDELQALPILAKGAALRFLITRCYDWLNQKEGAMVTPKDPLEYLKIIRFHDQVTSHKEYGL